VSQNNLAKEAGCDSSALRKPQCDHAVSLLLEADAKILELTTETRALAGVVTAIKRNTYA
jgi:hypothetical protein